MRSQLINFIFQVVGFSLFLTGCALTGTHQREVEEEALQWAFSMNLKEPRVSCVRDDSDDGAFTINDGCRVPKFGIKDF